MKKILVNFFLYYLIINNYALCQEKKGIFLNLYVDEQDINTKDISILFTSNKDSSKINIIPKENLVIPQKIINNNKISLIFFYKKHAILFENIPTRYILPSLGQKFIYWDFNLYMRYLEYYPELPVIDDVSYTFSAKSLEFLPKKIWKTK